MARLFKAGKIKVVVEGPPSKQRSRTTAVIFGVLVAMNEVYVNLPEGLAERILKWPTGQ
jgi:hypothetical protein